MSAPRNIIYLDNNATTQLDPAVLEEMMPFLTSEYANPSSGYYFGTRAREAVETARARVARLVGCEPGEIVFTSCGTESSNSAIRSALQLSSERQHIVTSAVEHSATLRPCEGLAKHGTPVTFAGVSSNGTLDLDELERAIRPDTAIVTLMWANNETGVLFPIDSIAEITQRNRVILHVDAVQAAGKVPMSLRDVPVQSASLSAHKLHGPKGVGALYLDRRSAFRPSMIGGGQENGRRGGTENVAGIVGFGKAAELARVTIEDTRRRVGEMRDRFERTLLATVADTSVNGEGAPRLPNTSSMAFAGIAADAMLMLLDQDGVCCSAGSACRTGSLEASHVLRAMQLSDERVRGTLRFSFSRFNTEAEIDVAISRIERAVTKLRRM